MYRLIYILLLCSLAGFINSSCIVAVHNLATAEDRAKKGKTDRNDERNFSERIFTNEEINYLRNSTTLFVIPESELDTKNLLKEAISTTWNFTDLKFITHKELKQYQNKNYSYFIIEGYSTHFQNYRTDANGMRTPSSSYDSPHVFLTLKHTYETTNKKGKKIAETINYCRVELFTDTETLNLMIDTKEDEIFEQLYEKGVFKNWTPGMIQLYLQEVQTHLRNTKREFLFESVNKEKALSRLKNDTLYIPDYILLKFNKFNGAETNRSAQTLFKGYDFPYKVVPSEELSQKIIAQEVNYVLDYVKSSSDKFVRIYDVNKGKIYQDYKAMSYNFKDKDIGKIKIK